MTRYCLEAGPNTAIIHKLDCSAYDLGTLLGLGRLVDLGEFPQLSLALDAIARQLPHARPCQACCEHALPLPPRLWRSAGLPAIVMPST